MRIFVASDHGGYSLKQELCVYLKTLAYDVVDVGPFEYSEEDDYVDYVVPLVRNMLNERDSKAVVICRNGVGVSMLANKFKGIRCALSWNIDHAISSRNDDDANVLALPADYIDLKLAKEMVKMWLDTPFSKEERHVRRVKKVEEVI